MNDDAALYAKSNNLQQFTSKRVLEEFAPLLQWREGDSVLDIGSGTGNVTVEVVLPILNPKFNHLIACDLSDEMIKYAQQHHNHPKVKFVKLDITKNVDEFLTRFGPFDHVVSFFCLQWVREQRQAIGNIRKLLTPSGNCLIVFPTSASVYTVFEEMSKSQKWSQYMQDIGLYEEACQNITDPVDDFRLLCQSVGFTTINIQTQEVKYIYENYEEYKSFLTSTNPFLKRIPVSEQEDYIIELLERQIAKNRETNESKFLLKFEITIIYAKK